MRRFVTAAVSVAGALALLASVGAAPATAASDGYWYYDGLGVAAAQSAGLTGKGVTIGVVGEQIDPGVPALKGANLHIYPQNLCGGSPTTDQPRAGYHTTNVVGLISGNGTWYDGQRGPKGVAPGARVNLYAAGVGVGEGGDDSSVDCPNGVDRIAAGIDKAVADRVDIISISAGSFGQLAPAATIDAVARALKAGIIVLAGTADVQDATTGTEFPAGANGVVGVGAFDAQVQLMTHSGQTVVDPLSKVVAPGVAVQTGGNRSDWRPSTLGVGTSYATPITAGVLALVKQKYPKATNAQLIQSLIRNTSADDHELVYQPETGWGYGPVSLKHLLAVDPTQYDDTNPLISDDPNLSPTRAQIENADLPSSNDPASTPRSTPSAEPSSGGPAWLLPVVIGGGILLLLVIAGVVVAIVATRRRPGAGS